MADYIKSLPTDEEKLGIHETFIMNTLLSNTQASEPILHKILAEIKEPIKFSVIFVLLQIPFIDEFIKSAVPYTSKHPYSLLIFKAVVFIVLGAVFF